MVKRTSEINTIYLLTNTENNKVYVGQTWFADLSHRMGREGNGYSNSVKLYNAIKKYGCDKFVYTVLEQCQTQEEADRLEALYMEKYQSRDPELGYNIKEAGSVGKHSEETKAKIAETTKQIAYWSHHVFPESAKAKIGEANSQKIRTQETKDQVSATMAEWHANNPHPMQGKKHTPEALEKISQASLGKKRSPESVEKGRQKQYMSQDRSSQIQELYLSGLTFDELEDQGFARSSVSRKIELFKLPPRVQKKFHAWFIENYPQEQNIPTAEEFWKLQREQHNLPPVVKQHSNDIKAKIANNTQNVWNKRKGLDFSFEEKIKEEHNKIINLYTEGKKVTEIKNIIGNISESAIYRVLRNNGVINSK